LSGSSPRVRGILLRFSQPFEPGRFIPAGAGNTRLATTTAGMNAVHPRGCGEYGPHAPEPVELGGSSPRVRGIPRLKRARALEPRFIPAGAGNTTSLLAILWWKSVHPRGCGEYSVSDSSLNPHRGSSPRVRGIRRRGWAACSRPPVHPRGCGEYQGVASALAAFFGSSPRVRGIRPIRDAIAHGARFIPAGAGNTRSRAVRTRSRSVHPRGCGEYVWIGEGPGSPCGSSPRVRGIRKIKDSNGLPLGSSPRVRGIHLNSVRARHRRRFIPAGAGNTVTWSTSR